MPVRSVQSNAATQLDELGAPDTAESRAAARPAEPPAGAQAGGVDAFRGLAARWLDWQCRMISGALTGAVFFSDDQGGDDLAAAAVWPANATGAAPLRKLAAEAMLGRSGVSHKHGERTDGDAAVRDYVAYPLMSGERAIGAVALVLEIGSQAQRQAVLQLLQWGTVWLEEAVNEALRQRRDRAPLLTDLVAVALRDGPLPVVCHELCNRLADQFGATSTAIGLTRGLQVRLRGIAHQVNFDRRLSQVRRIEAAMEECVDQVRVLAVPHPDEDQSGLTRMHAELAAADGGNAVCSVPLRTGGDDGRVIGVVTLARPGAAGFDRAGLDLLDKAAELLAPVLELRLREAQPVWVKAWRAVRGLFGRLFGRGHLRLKAVTAVVLTVVAALLWIQTDHRVSARATVEGSMQQAVVAPYAGFIAAARARAGDTVAAGQVLARLDDRELVLQRERWVSEHHKHAQEYQEALAEGDRARLSILAARMAQTQAQLDLVEEQLRRTELRAPFDGVLVSGDLSRALGAPVERGQLLFEIAPLDGFRVDLQVDEHDVADLAQGQLGSLRLTGFPDHPVEVRVSRVLPMANAEQGANHFRVEAQIQSAGINLRPGMEGVAKVVVGRDNLLRVWTHELVDRLRLWAWSVGW